MGAEHTLLSLSALSFSCPSFSLSQHSNKFGQPHRDSGIQSCCVLVIQYTHTHTRKKTRPSSTPSSPVSLLFSFPPSALPLGPLCPLRCATPYAVLGERAQDKVRGRFGANSQHSGDAALNRRSGSGDGAQALGQRLFRRAAHCGGRMRAALVGER